MTSASVGKASSSESVELARPNGDGLKTGIGVQGSDPLISSICGGDLQGSLNLLQAMGLLTGESCGGSFLFSLNLGGDLDLD